MFRLELQSYSSSPPRSSSSLFMQPWTSFSRQLYLFPDVDHDSFGDSHDHPNIGTPRQGPRSHWSLHLLLARSQYQLTDWTLLPSAALNHVSMCSQSCANQTHLDTSCCWQYYDVLSYVFIMVSCYRWSGSHPGFMLRFWPYLTPHFLFVLGKNCPKDFSVSKDGSKAHTFDDTTWDLRIEICPWL